MSDKILRDYSLISSIQKNIPHKPLVRDRGDLRYIY